MEISRNWGRYYAILENEMDEIVPNSTVCSKIA